MASAFGTLRNSVRVGLLRKVLGLPDGTKNHQVLKKAYRWCAQLSFALLQLRRVSKVRQAALKWHPDKNPNDPHAASNFQKACNAFEQLGKSLVCES